MFGFSLFLASIIFNNYLTTPMTESAQQQQPGAKDEFKGMRFCTECDNMLEPREF